MVLKITTHLDTPEEIACMKSVWHEMNLFLAPSLRFREKRIIEV